MQGLREGLPTPQTESSILLLSLSGQVAHKEQTKESKMSGNGYYKMSEVNTFLYFLCCICFTILGRNYHGEFGKFVCFSAAWYCAFELTIDALVAIHKLRKK